MKNAVLTLWLALLLVACVLTGCDLFDKADDVSFSTTIENSVVVSETQNTNFASDVVVDANSNAEINKYKNHLKDFKVNKIKYKITEYTSTKTVMTTAAISYSSSISGTQVSLGSVTGLNLQQAAATETEYELSVPAEELKKIGTLLKNDKAVKFYLTGTLSGIPVSFRVKFIVDTEITASAL